MSPRPTSSFSIPFNPHVPNHQPSSQTKGNALSTKICLERTGFSRNRNIDYFTAALAKLAMFHSVYGSI